MTALSEIIKQLHHYAKAGGQTVPQLMAVSKNQSMESITSLLNQGHRLFGENRVQEAQEKWAALRETFGGVSLHLIGPLQTNKVRQAVALFDAIQTIDRVNLAEKIAEEWKKNPRPLSFFIQVNVGDEPQKSGVLEENFHALFERCQDLGLPIVGLMAIPPQNQDPTPYFKRLKALARQYNLPQLSMGMSHDFHQAILCGTTMVRLGTLLFGERL